MINLRNTLFFLFFLLNGLLMNLEKREFFLGSENKLDCSRDIKDINESRKKEKYQSDKIENDYYFCNNKKYFNNNQSSTENTSLIDNVELHHTEENIQINLMYPINSNDDISDKILYIIENEQMYSNTYEFYDV
jgi:hypothetical protein